MDLFKVAAELVEDTEEDGSGGTPPEPIYLSLDDSSPERPPTRRGLLPVRGVMTIMLMV